MNCIYSDNMRKFQENVKKFSKGEKTKLGSQVVAHILWQIQNPMSF